MAVNMSGAIIPKDISICSVVEEIARQIDHFTRERARLCLFSVWHSRVHYSATKTSFATILEVIHKSEKRGILRSFELKKMLRSLEKMRTHPP